MKTIRSGSEAENSFPDVDESLKKDDQNLPQEAAEQRVPEQELVKPETAELVRAELESQLKEFYTAIKRKYADPEAGWTPAKLEANSPNKLAPIIRDFRNILREAGAADPDGLIGELVSVVQETVAEHKLKHDFLNKVLDHSAMVYNSGLEKFYRSIAKGLEKGIQARKATT
jgi:hypothetical protein